MKPTVELLFDAKAKLGEGVCWDAGRNILYWVDILEKEVHVFDPATGKDRMIRLNQYVGAAVPTTDGDLLLAMHHGFGKLNMETEALTPIYDPEHHLADNRFNDGKCDPAGRFWAGTMNLEANGKTGSLYRMDNDFSVHKMVDNVTISNGLAWSSDHKTMYYIDTAQHEVSAFDYHLETGTIADRRTVIRFDSNIGHPDGMTIDEEDMLWVAYCGGGRVARWNPVTSQLLLEIELPVSLVTNCVFGGPNLDTLYISSARVTLSDDDLKQQPSAGGVFSIKPGVQGLMAPSFNILTGEMEHESKK